jgi:hypothetical protein
MPRTRPPYPPAFRAEVVRLIRSGPKPLTEIAKDVGGVPPEADCYQPRIVTGSLAATTSGGGTAVLCQILSGLGADRGRAAQGRQKPQA